MWNVDGKNVSRKILGGVVSDALIY